MKFNSKIYLYSILILFFLTSGLFAQTKYPVIMVKGKFAVIKKPEGTKLKTGQKLNVFSKEKNREVFIATVQVDKITAKYLRLKVVKTAYHKKVKKGDYVKIKRSVKTSLNKYPIHNRNKKRNWQIGLTAGTNIDATYDYTPNSALNYNKFIPKKSFGFSAGINVDYNIYKIIYLNFNPLYGQSTSAWTIEMADKNDLEAYIELLQVEFPLALKIRTGPVYFLLGANYSLIVNSSGEPNDMKEEKEESVLYYLAGIGLQFNMAREWNLYIESRYNYAPDNLLTEEDTNFRELYPGGFKILAGINYQF